MAKEIGNAVFQEYANDADRTCQSNRWGSGFVLHFSLDHNHPVTEAAGCDPGEVPGHRDPPSQYAFKDADGVIQALAPAHIIESGLPTEALLAQISVSKYADGLPLFRQEGIYARDGVEIDRRLMAQWMGRVGFELEILAAHVLGEILRGPRVFPDETSLPALAPGTGTVKKAWLWAYARDDSTFGGSGPPMVAYRLEADPKLVE